MKNNKIMFLLVVFLWSNCFLYVSEHKPDIQIPEGPCDDICYTVPVMPNSGTDNGFVSDFELDEEAKKPDTGSIKEEEGFAFLSRELARVSLQPKKKVSQEEMLKQYLVSVRAAAGKKPKNSEAFKVGEPKTPHQKIEHVGPKAKGSLAFLSAKRRNTEKSYPGLFWDKRK